MENELAPAGVDPSINAAIVNGVCTFPEITDAITDIPELANQDSMSAIA